MRWEEACEKALLNWWWRWWSVGNNAPSTASTTTAEDHEKYTNREKGRIYLGIGDGGGEWVGGKNRVSEWVRVTTIPFQFSKLKLHAIMRVLWRVFFLLTRESRRKREWVSGEHGVKGKMILLLHTHIICFFGPESLSHENTNNCFTAASPPPPFTFLHTRLSRFIAYLYTHGKR